MVDVTHSYNGNHSAIGTILKDKDKIVEHVTSAVPVKSTIISQSVLLLSAWIHDEHRYRVPFSLMLFRKEAKSLFEDVKGYQAGAVGGLDLNSSSLQARSQIRREEEVVPLSKKESWGEVPDGESSRCVKQPFHQVTAAVSFDSMSEEQNKQVLDPERKEGFVPSDLLHDLGASGLRLLMQPNSGPELVLSEDEKTDSEDKEETELGVMEDQRSIILHLISQLKLGMDLTKVVLPTFILEKRSLLEMYADFMTHPDLLLAITAGATPEERVICFVEYYLTAFREGRKGALAKKPYNPIIGETFHCSWEVPRDRVKPKRTAPPSSAGCQEHPVAEDPSRSYKLRFVAEQVSHHPPISCFYCECKEKRLCVNTHVWTKSKFMGMSVGVSMIGEGVLKLLEHGEEYVFTLPSAYARSILTIPWVELGGKVSINCAKTGYSATVIFHTKPFYGGKVHRVTAEVKHNPTNTIVCKAHGEWNGILEFTYSNGETKVIDTTTLPVYPKRIRPLEKQGPMESRNLWQEVTRYLHLGDIDAATEQKRQLEEKQRIEERKRDSLCTAWRPKYFIQEGDGWVYFNPLWKAY
ncbi:Oxysterol-binding protein-related protein 10 [Fukomys damarensis]|uniref:Oxysterol-binding protein n=1 Tax=Fukomys damarensis TaxID=885580 RepID=A0A091D895_FUKDA|nr:Oxysterol-binding protein-related protein 10 [Fukomys damarensis]